MAVGAASLTSVVGFVRFSSALEVLFRYSARLERRVLSRRGRIVYFPRPMRRPYFPRPTCEDRIILLIRRLLRLAQNGGF